MFTCQRCVSLHFFTRYPRPQFWWLIAGWLLWFPSGVAQEIPQIRHFSKKEYKGQNQNWSIAQGPDQRMYFGNYEGVLHYDGAWWRRLAFPTRQVVRAVACDNSGRVFAGGFATAGFWQTTPSGKQIFTSILDALTDPQIHHEEFWHILITREAVYFQSFTLILRYDFHTTTVLRLPGNSTIMFMREVHGKIIVPSLHKGLFFLDESLQFRPVPGSERFNQKRVAAILPYGPRDALICTERDGVYRWSADGFTPWTAPVSAELRANQLNKAIRLRNGRFAFGTILRGIYITDSTGSILYHIHRGNGLQNNAVLALLEDRAGQLWVGMDKGIDLVNVQSPLQFYLDIQGALGSVYAAALFEGNFYAGTNQGLFYKPFKPATNLDFQLYAGMQGHVWELREFDGQLLVCSNSGVLRIQGDQGVSLFNRTGCFTTMRHPARNDVLIQGAYTGINILRKNASGKWIFSHQVSGFSQPARHLAFDRSGNLWALHPRQGLFRIRLDTTLRIALDVKAIGNAQGVPTTPDLDMLDCSAPDIIIRAGKAWLKLDFASGRFNPIRHWRGIALEENMVYLTHGQEAVSWFKIYPEKVVWLPPGQTPQTFPVFMLPDHWRVLPLADSLYLFCNDNGYSLLHTNRTGAYSREAQALPAPVISEIRAGAQRFFIPAGSDTAFKLSHRDNAIRFYFSMPVYDRQVPLRYQLEGFEQKFSEAAAVYEKEYTNLPAGRYRFVVSSAFTGQTTAVNFEISPPWHDTIWAQSGFLLLIVTLLVILLKWHALQLRKQEVRLAKEKAKALQQERMEARNQRLQQEIINKSRQLADSTMGLVRKNEILQQIKEKVVGLQQPPHNGNPQKMATSVLHLIDGHLSSEEDWQIFEANFNQLHHQFFTRLKAAYPDLSPGDLRLAAYLKMNLSSKDIAPLLNMSLHSVENKRYRLRRKLRLSATANLTEFLMQY